MKRVLIAALITALIAPGFAEATTQQIPFLHDLLLRVEKFNQLYTEKRRAGADLSAIEPLRRRGEEAFNKFNINALLEIYGEGLTLLQGGKWDELHRFAYSLTMAQDRSVIEPNQELQVALARMYPSNIEKAFAAPPTVTFEIVPANPSDKQPVEPILIARQLQIGETLTNASRRLRLLDGVYWIVATIESGGRKVTEIRKPLYAISDFNERIKDLAALVAQIRDSTDLRVKVFSNLVATPEYQLLRLAPLNSKASEGELNVFAELDRIESLLTSLAAGENPFTEERGELERAYRAADGRLMPYRVYVPKSYDGVKATPLVVMLHGALGDERTYFSGLYDPEVIKGEAERRGYILASPNGGGRLSGYGEAGQEDALEVIKCAIRDYEIDETKIYLTGHSMGAAGVWLVATRRPEMFAAIATVSGGGPGKKDETEEMLKKIKAIPALIVHGAKDGIVPPDNSKKMAAFADKAGIKVSHVEVPNADHITVVAETFPAILDFFAKNSKQPGAN